MTRPTSPFPPPSRSAPAAYRLPRVRRGRRRRDPRGRRTRGARPRLPRAPAGTGRDPRRARPRPRRRTRRRRPVPRAGGRERRRRTATVIGPDRTAYTLPAEASGRTAVRLDPGEHVEFTLPAAANAITVRYSIPDAPTGGGITAPLEVSVDGGAADTMTLTSRVRVAVQPVPVHERPERRPAAPRLVDHRVRVRARRGLRGAEAVPPDALLRRAADAPRRDVRGRLRRPPHRTAGHGCRVDRDRPARLRARRRRRRRSPTAR